jgi:hypothetical protein
MTETEIDKIWKDDLLSRRQEAALLYQFMCARFEERQSENTRGSYVLNLDEDWGRGKTFFLTRFSRQVRMDNHLCAYVNSWQDDSHRDPALAVMAAIDEVLQPLIADRTAAANLWDSAKRAGGKVLISTAKGLAKTAAKKFIGDEIDSVISAFSGSDEDGERSPARKTFGEEAADSIGADSEKRVETLAAGYIREAIRDYRTANSAASDFRRNTSAALKQLEQEGALRLPMFIVIDELDRCRPTYAVEMLEQVKHLFDISGVVYLFGTNISQLVHSVSAIYGDRFDSRAYLNRFFNRQYVFEVPDMESFVSSLFAQHPRLSERLACPPDATPESLFSGAMVAFNRSLRDAEQCFDYIRTVTSLWFSPTQIVFPYLLALVILFQRGDVETFEMVSLSGAYNWSSVVKNPWRLVSKRRSREGHIIIQDVVVLLEKIRSLAGRTLPDITRLDYPNSPYDRWVHEQFRNELAQLHNNSWQGAEPHSILRTYGALIKGAGRLKSELVSNV